VRNPGGELNRPVMTQIALAISFIQDRALMHRDVFRLIALDFILWFIRAGAVHVSFVIYVFDVDPDNLAAHISCFRVPGHMIANREPLFHENTLRYGFR
jgi:hypothetical protein